MQVTATATEIKSTYSLKDLAEKLGATPDAIRLRWLPSVFAVAPESALRVSRTEYTERCLELLENFKARPGTAQEWVENFQKTENFQTENGFENFHKAENAYGSEFRQQSDSYLAKAESFQFSALQELQRMAAEIQAINAEISQQKEEMEDSAILTQAIAEIKAEQEQNLAEVRRLKKLEAAKLQLKESMGLK